jgi:hypothetical protein
MEKKSQEAFSIVSFLPRESGVKADTPSFQPYAIKREHDGEVFTIGDLITNGTHIKGKITSFEMLNDKVFVNHTWSGVGVNLGSIRKVIELPSRHQVGDKVKFSINQKGSDVDYVVHSFDAEIKAVHFYTPKVKYDIEIPIEGESPTRIYNVDSFFVEPI